MSDTTYAHQVEALGREDGIYLFADSEDARAFAQAIEDGGGDCVVDDAAVNETDGANALIREERATVLDDLGVTGIAGDLRDNKADDDVVTMSRAIKNLGRWPFGVGTAEELAAERKAQDLLSGWILTDERRTDHHAR